MGRRLQRLTSEAAKFLTVGGVASLVAVLVFNVLVHGFFGRPAGPLNERPLTAFVAANLLGMVISYRGSRSWVFRHRQVVGAVGGRISFLVINLLSMAIPLLALAVSRYVLGLDSGLADNVSANVIGLGLGTAARFWAFRRFVFRRRDSGSRFRESRGLAVASDAELRPQVGPGESELGKHLAE